MAQLAAAHAGLPDDLVNFHWDPLTAAIATGWGATDPTMSRPDRNRSGQGATRTPPAANSGTAAPGATDPTHVTA